MRKLANLMVMIMALSVLVACGGEADKGAGKKADEPVVIKLSYANFPPAKTFPCVQMEWWAKEVAKRTNGKIKVETFPGSTLLNPKNMFSGVLEGQADIGCMSLAYQPGVFPVTLATNMPVGFSSATVASMTLWDFYQKHQPKELSKVKVLTMFTSAPSNIMSKVDVKSLDDLKGLELRASGSVLQMLELLGAKPVGMPMSATPEALQKGVVKGLASSFDVLMDFNFAELCRSETITNLPVYPFAVVMNQDKWNSLPEDVKKVMADLGRETALWTGQYLDKHINKSLAWSRDKYDVKVYNLTGAEMGTIKTMGEKLIADWKVKVTAKGLDANALMNDVYELKKKYEAEYPAK